jgi:hypothetical protein
VNIRPNLIWFCGPPLVVVGLLLLVFLPPGYLDHTGVCYLFGTVFGQATLAAAWTAFGPLPLLWRLPLSLLWVSALVAANAFNSVLYCDGLFDFDYVLAGCLGGQYALLQLPFWGLALTCGLRLQYHGANSPRPSARELQFGIRQLMILTAVVAVLLGAGRHVFTYVYPTAENQVSTTVFMVFLCVAAILVTVPLILVALLPRFAIPAVATVLVLTGLFTAFEHPLYYRLDSSGLPSGLYFVFINGFTSAWILVIALLVRISGYRFGKSGSRAMPA